jgi:hypothetical protein
MLDKHAGSKTMKVLSSALPPSAQTSLSIISFSAPGD